MKQGVQALDRSAAGAGLFGSGNNAAALTQYGQGLANQEYGNWLQRLAGLGAQGFNAATGQLSRQGQLAGIYTNLGKQQADIATNAANQYTNLLSNNANNQAQAQAQGGSNLGSALLGGANLAARIAFPGSFVAKG
jgi:hypothetical protein